MRYQAIRKGRGGFTLLEMMLAMSVFIVGMGGALSALLGANLLSREALERSLAMRAAQSTLAQLRGETFDNAFAEYNDDPLDGGWPSGDFAVQGLTAQTGDPDGLCGRVTFPGDGVSLREDFVDRELGTPRDLNLDGVVDNLDHSGDYEVLPVRVTVAWRGARGDRQVTVATTLVERQ